MLFTKLNIILQERTLKDAILSSTSMILVNKVMLKYLIYFIFEQSKAYTHINAFQCFLTFFLNIKQIQFLNKTS